MIRVHVICEGSTEEDFVRDILATHLNKKEIYLLPSCIGKVGHKGGNVNLQRLETDVKNRLLEERQCFCTSFLDYYGLPDDFPGKKIAKEVHDITDKQIIIHQALTEHFQKKLDPEIASRFIPYIQMHEFEALLFSNPYKLACAIGCEYQKEAFAKIRNSFSTPEWINDNLHTAPNKRISKIFPAYSKPIHPLLSAAEIGLETIRQECKLFNSWIERLENLTQ